jgi:hypothetical protein
MYGRDSDQECSCHDCFSAFSPGKAKLIASLGIDPLSPCT